MSTSPVLASEGTDSENEGATTEVHEDPRLTRAVVAVRTLSNPRLKEQCIRTEWASTETELERDLLASVATEHSFWDEVKQMAIADVESLPSDETETSIDERLTQMFGAFDKDNSGTIDANELHQMLLYMGISTTEKEVRDMIAQVDESGTGAIELDKFLVLMKAAQHGPDKLIASSPSMRRASSRSTKNISEHERIRADFRRVEDGAAATQKPADS